MSEATSPQFSEALLEALPDGVVVATPDGRIVAVNGRLGELSGRSRGDLVGTSVESLVPGRFRAEHVALRVGYVADGGGLRAMSARPDIVLVRADGREVPVDVALSTFGTGDDRVVFASVRDASARREAELAREREYRFLEAMSDVTTALFSEGEVDETLRTITRQARVLLGADLAVLAVPEPEGDALRLRIADGYGADRYEGETIPIAASLAGLVMRDRAPLLVADASADARAHRDGDWPDDLGPTLVVPLHAGDEALAALSIAHRRGGPMFRAADVTLMKTFAAHATVAILEARNQVQLRLTEVLDDRDRVAASMQDGVIKRISSAALTLHSVLKLDIPDAAKDRLWGVVEELDTAVALARDAVFPR